MTVPDHVQDWLARTACAVVTLEAVHVVRGQFEAAEEYFEKKHADLIAERDHLRDELEAAKKLVAQAERRVLRLSDAIANALT
jgi:hypothetical protein